ncbi:hypothetical protein N7470_009703 [Penicillium chermesinum]|nr:hypothetical protein N7470_009703 [Penicillium chermesinum]
MTLLGMMGKPQLPQNDVSEVYSVVKGSSHISRRPSQDLLDVQVQAMSSFQAGPFNQAQTPQGTSTSFLQQGVSRDVVDDNLHDLNILWGSLDTFPLEGFGRGLPNELITLPELDIPESINSELTAPMTGDTLGNVRLDSPLSDDDASLSNFQLPPLQHNEDSQDTDNVLHTSESIPSEPHIPWRISKEDYQLTLGKIEHVRHILPESFSFPSKYVFCRYIEGYFTGSHGHLPFLHLPTVTVAHLTPALVLAIMAMGAQYRFEQARAVKFYKASRALINDHINLHSTSNSLYTPGSQLDTIDRTEKTHFEVLQAQIILTTLGTWGNHDLLHDTLGMAGQMSLYLQDSGLLLHDRHSDDGSWLAWIQQEGQRRTKYIAYMICNVQTILYNMPPKILNSEITSILLPWPEELWSATCAADWKSLRSKWAKSVTFGEVYSQLFRHQPNHRIYSSLSSFGYLILIHGIFQQIYLAWESSCCLPGSSEGHPMALPHELLTRFHTALRRWQKGWETSSDPSITPASRKGPSASMQPRSSASHASGYTSTSGLTATWEPQTPTRSHLRSATHPDPPSTPCRPAPDPAPARRSRLRPCRPRRSTMPSCNPSTPSPSPSDSAWST